MNEDLYDSYPPPRRSESRACLVLLVFGLACVLFLIAGVGAGVVLDRSGLLPNVSNREPPGLVQTFEPFWETWNLVDQRYVDREAVQPQRMTEGAIQGMLASLGDVGHTTYLTRDEFQRLQSGLKGELDGIGARMTMRRAGPTVVHTIGNSPARAAGLRAGDVLMEVDHQPVAGLSLTEIVDKVRGPAGTQVHLSVLRKGQTKLVELDIDRARVDVPDVTWHMLPGTRVAHVAIQNFGEQTDKQLRGAIGEARARGVRGLLLDVRANPGGLKDQAVAVTSEFLKGGVVFIEKDAKGNQKEVPVKEGGIATDLPACLLIDLGTASSSEIMAGALQDHGRAKLVGTRTFGTGTVLAPFKLTDGSAVLLAIAEWLTPKGRQIWKKGIQPDVQVSMPEDALPLLPDSETDLDAAGLAKSQDKQLLKGLEVLQKEIPNAGR